MALRRDRAQAGARHRRVVVAGQHLRVDPGTGGAVAAAGALVRRPLGGVRLERAPLRLGRPRRRDTTTSSPSALRMHEALARRAGTAIPARPGRPCTAGPTGWPGARSRTPTGASAPATARRLFRDLAARPTPGAACRARSCTSTCTANVLFAGTAPPAVIDFTPYWRPALLRRGGRCGRRARVGRRADRAGRPMVRPRRVAADAAPGAAVPAGGRAGAPAHLARPAGPAAVHGRTARPVPRLTAVTGADRPRRRGRRGGPVHSRRGPCGRGAPGPSDAGPPPCSPGAAGRQPVPGLHGQRTGRPQPGPARRRRVGRRQPPARRTASAAWASGVPDAQLISIAGHGRSHLDHRPGQHGVADRHVLQRQRRSGGERRAARARRRARRQAFVGQCECLVPSRARAASGSGRRRGPRGGVDRALGLGQTRPGRARRSTAPASRDSPARPGPRTHSRRPQPARPGRSSESGSGMPGCVRSARPVRGRPGATVAHHEHLHHRDLRRLERPQELVQQWRRERVSWYATTATSSACQLRIPGELSEPVARSRPRADPPGSPGPSGAAARTGRPAPGCRRGWNPSRREWRRASRSAPLTRVGVTSSVVVMARPCPKRGRAAAGSSRGCGRNRRLGTNRRPQWSGRRPLSAQDAMRALAIALQAHPAGLREHPLGAQPGSCSTARCGAGVPSARSTRCHGVRLVGQVRQHPAGQPRRRRARAGGDVAVGGHTARADAADLVENSLRQLHVHPSSQADRRRRVDRTSAFATGRASACGALSAVRDCIGDMVQATVTDGALPAPAVDARGSPAACWTPEQSAVVASRRRQAAGAGRPGHRQDADPGRGRRRADRDRGVPAESILVLTFSRRAAAELTDRITRRLGAHHHASRSCARCTPTPIRVLRGPGRPAGEPAPRLLAAGESDQMVRELLAGHREAGRHGWPESLRRRWRSTAFAAELRDLLLRAAERGVGPGRLAEWGRRRKRPEWVAAARFAREYQDVADLRQGTSGFGPALDQAELTTAALARARRRSGAGRRAGAASAGSSSTSTRTSTRPRRASSSCSVRRPTSWSSSAIRTSRSTASAAPIRGRCRISRPTGRFTSPPRTDCRPSSSARPAGIAALLPGPGAHRSLSRPIRRRTAPRRRPGSTPRWSVRCRPPPRRPLSSPMSCVARTCSTACRGRAWRCCPVAGRDGAGPDPGLPRRRRAGDRRLLCVRARRAARSCGCCSRSCAVDTGRRLSTAGPPSIC